VLTTSSSAGLIAGGRVGIYSTSNLTSSGRTPGLSRIPIFKWLFKRDSVDDSDTELMIFITPHIIKG